jgi:hypothetical protein
MGILGNAHCSSRFDKLRHAVVPVTARVCRRYRGFAARDHLHHWRYDEGDFSSRDHNEEADPPRTDAAADSAHTHAAPQT